MEKETSAGTGQQMGPWPQISVCEWGYLAIDNRVSRNTEELRAMHLNYHTTTSRLINVERFSKWERLVRSLAYAYHIFQRYKHRADKYTEHLTREELQHAARTIWKMTQHETYQDKLSILNNTLEQSDGHPNQIEKTVASTGYHPLWTRTAFCAWKLDWLETA